MKKSQEEIDSLVAVKDRLDTKYYPRPDHDKAVMKGELRLDRHAYRIPFKAISKKEAEVQEAINNAVNARLDDVKTFSVLPDLEDVAET